jgi:Family of unknown function (DUF6526)
MLILPIGFAVYAEPSLRCQLPNTHLDAFGRRTITLLDSFATIPWQQKGASMAEQNLSNHTRVFPPFHFFVLPVLLVNFGWSIYRLKTYNFTIDAFVSVFVGAALIMGFLSARIFALTVQDRVIRLEERLRYQRLLPADLQARIGEFTVNQLVSLRFASDAELPALARKVLDDKLNERKAIKQLVKNWKPDYLRA